MQKTTDHDVCRYRPEVKEKRFLLKIIGGKDMPYSGGGGSHRGGSHGGGHSSGGRRGGSSSRGGSGGGYSAPQKYVYYQGKKPHYFYADRSISSRSLPIWLHVILFLPLFFFAAVPLAYGISGPKMVNPYYESVRYAEDNLGIITKEDEILQRFDVFYEKTGITPVFITVYNEDWNEDYENMERYAYDLYKSTFENERHMLIVYSEPRIKDPDFLDWYWELMQGNDTAYILNEKVDARFTETFQKNLTIGKVSVDDALIAAFDEITPGIMRGPQSIPALVTGAFAEFMLILILAAIIESKVKDKKYYNKIRRSTPCPDTIVEEECQYCGGIYVVGTCLSCPHCGGQLPPHYYPPKEKAEAGTN